MVFGLLRAMKHSCFLGGLLSLVAAGLLLAAAPAATVLAKVRQYRQRHEPELLAEYLRLLAIPSVAADSAGRRRTAATIAEMMRQRGLTHLCPARWRGLVAGGTH